MTYRGYTEAQNKATQKYVKKAYDRFVVTIRKDQAPDADAVRAAANALHMSANEYIKWAVRERIKADASAAGMNEDQYVEMVKANWKEKKAAADQTTETAPETQQDATETKNRPPIMKL